MTKLKSEFVKGGYLHKQVKRTGSVALFERKRVDGADGGREHWEVVRIREGREWVVAGNVVPAAELYPGSEQWGTLGFTYSNDNRAGAEHRFAEMSSEG